MSTVSPAGRNKTDVDGEIVLMLDCAGGEREISAHLPLAVPPSPWLLLGAAGFVAARHRIG